MKPSSNPIQNFIKIIDKLAKEGNGNAGGVSGGGYGGGESYHW